MSTKTFDASKLQSYGDAAAGQSVFTCAASRYKS
jgi:hypothetical protein